MTLRVSVQILRAVQAQQAARQPVPMGSKGGAVNDPEIEASRLTNRYKLPTWNMKSAFASYQRHKR